MCFYMLRNVGNTAAQKNGFESPVDLFHQLTDIRAAISHKDGWTTFTCFTGTEKNKAFLTQDFAACLLCGYSV